MGYPEGGLVVKTRMFEMTELKRGRGFWERLVDGLKNVRRHLRRAYWAGSPPKTLRGWLWWLRHAFVEDFKRREGQVFAFRPDVPLKVGPDEEVFINMPATEAEEGA